MLYFELETIISVQKALCEIAEKARGTVTFEGTMEVRGDDSQPLGTLLVHDGGQCVSFYPDPEECSLDTPGASG